MTMELSNKIILHGLITGEVQERKRIKGKASEEGRKWEN